MKTLLTIVSCLALCLTASAKQDNNNPNKKKKQGPPQGQMQQHPQGGKGKNKMGGGTANAGQMNQGGQGQGGGGGGKGKHNKNKGQNAQGQANAGEMGQGKGKGKHNKNQNGDVQNANKNAKKMAKHEKVEAKKFDNLAKGPKQGVDSEKFVQGKHIKGSENWHGEKYVVFKNYHCEWHDHDWWHHHYSNVILISGGWYAFNNGFWFPAWGYDPAVAYYPYDGPIYAYHNLPPDQVIANVQANLQAQGYYQGEVDGLLGPLTRAALAQYQADNGLTETAAIDEPTLDSLGMS